MYIHKDGEGLTVRNVTGVRYSEHKTHPRTAEASGIFTTLDELYFTTAEKKVLENSGCIVPNFNND
jgi:hypothetical protein